MAEHWLLILAGLAAIFVVGEAVFYFYGDQIAKMFPGWKNEMLAWGLRIVGIVTAIDPQILAPLFGNSPYTGLFIFVIGQLIAGLRSVTAVPGSNISPTLQSAVAIHTLVRQPPQAIEQGTVYLEKREKSAKEKKLTKAVGTLAAKKVRTK